MFLTYLSVISDKFLILISISHLYIIIYIASQLVLNHFSVVFLVISQLSFQFFVTLLSLLPICQLRFSVISELLIFWHIASSKLIIRHVTMMDGDSFSKIFLTATCKLFRFLSVPLCCIFKLFPGCA